MRTKFVSLLILFPLLVPSASKASDGVLLVNYNVENAPVVKQAGDQKFFLEDTGDVLSKLAECTDNTCVDQYKDQLARLKAIDVVSGSFRWVGTQRDSLDVIIFYKKTQPDVSFKEDPRSTIFVQQVGTIIGGVFGTQSKLAEPPFSVTRTTYDLTKTRATLTVTIGLKAADKATTPAQGKGTSIISVLTTGPTEHLFLSADTVFNKVSEKTYDKTAKVVKARDAANHPYAGVNVALSDIIASSWNPYVKGMMSIQSKPLDSWGLGAGLKLPSTLLGSFNLNTIAPFAAVTWDRSSAKLPSGAFVDGHRYKAHLRGGISLDVAGIAKAITGGGASSAKTAAKSKAS